MRHAPRGRWFFFKVGVMNELQYRVNFFVQLLQSLIQVGTGLVMPRSCTRTRPSSTAGRSRSCSP